MTIPRERDSVTAAYVHGPLECHLCFDGADRTLALGDWRLHNNPGYWGNPSPRVLILGFSKGANQNRAADSGEFDGIAFAGMRPRLQAVLQALGLMPDDRGIDHLMTARETEFGFASLVRCSLCRMKGGLCRTSGDVIPSAFTNPDTLAIIRRCAGTYLQRLPESVRLVVLLGTADAYIARTRSIVSERHADLSVVNDVAFRAGGALWLYGACQQL